MIKRIPLVFVLFATYSLFALDSKDITSQDRENVVLLNHYIQSKGNNIIVFDSSNIKRYWIDKSVLSRNNSFEITLKENGKQGFESVPHKIQLANVSVTQDCKIEIIADSKNFDCSVINNRKKVLSSSSQEDKFIDYNIVSSTFHLEDTLNSTFELVFHSKTERILSIKKIVLSFSENKESRFLASPGVLNITQNNIDLSSAQVVGTDLSSLSITGKRTRIISTKKILVSDNTLSSSVKIKNTGSVDTRVFIGYVTYTKNNIQLSAANYPYNNINKSLGIISLSDDNKRIIVDSYPTWSKNCYLALNVKEDLSDIPNTSLGGRILEIKQLNNGQAEILLEKALTIQLKKGDNVRIHGMSGAYLYMTSYLLHPGEEKEFISSIKKDNSFLEYSSKALSRDVDHVVPLILSYSIDPNEDNTIQISDFHISY